MRHRLDPFIYMAAMALPGVLHAQAFDLGEIVVSANLEETEASRIGATVIVVDQADLQASGETNLIDFLVRVPGVSIRPNGPLGASTGFTVRGASQNYVPVLIDGIEVSDPSAPQNAFNFGGFTTAGISRIEILKGSQSAIYGSDAIGGVINITTRRATQDGVHHFIETSYGANDTKTFSYGLTAKGRNYDFATTYAHVTSDGFSAADEDAGNTENDGFRSNRLSFNGSYTLDNGVRLGASGFYEDNYSEFDESFPAVADGTPDEFNNNKTWGARAFMDFSTGTVDHTVALSYFEIDRESNSDGFASLFEGSREKISYQGAANLGSARLVFGADTTKEKSSDSFGFSADTRTNGLFGELRLAPAQTLDLTLSARQDDHSDFGGFTTGRLAMAWRAQPDLILRSSLARGFRAPSNFELSSSFGDPGLRPERSYTADLGVEKRFVTGASLRVTGFYLEVDDLIDFDFTTNVCGSGFGCFAQVPGTSRRKGIEAEAELPLTDRITLAAAYTYTDSSTNASSAWALVPKHDFVATLRAAITDSMRGLISAQHVADRAGQGDYTVVNSALTYDFAKNTQGYVRLENLLDEDYQLVPGFGTSDRAIYVGLRQSF
jgi:vitamin B12 transporter